MLMRPKATEHNPYYERYIQLVPDGHLLEILKNQHEETNGLLKNTSTAQEEFRYAEGKWSLKQVIGHMSDTERIMSYRLLVIARGDQTALPPFDENAYVQGASFNQLTLKDLLADWSLVRQSTRSLISTLSDDAFFRTGSVSGYLTSARALAYIIAGHELHHRTIMIEKYL